jgi:hypothetical protein
MEAAAAAAGPALTAAEQRVAALKARIQQVQVSTILRQLRVIPSPDAAAVTLQRDNRPKDRGTRVILITAPPSVPTPTPAPVTAPVPSATSAADYTDCIEAISAAAGGVPMDQDGPLDLSPAAAAGARTAAALAPAARKAEDEEPPDPEAARLQVLFYFAILRRSVIKSK